VRASEFPTLNPSSIMLRSDINVANGLHAPRVMAGPGVPGQRSGGPLTNWPSVPLQAVDGAPSRTMTQRGQCLGQSMHSFPPRA
jgi:hypothetical protein